MLSRKLVWVALLLVGCSSPPAPVRDSHAAVSPIPLTISPQSTEASLPTKPSKTPTDSPLTQTLGLTEVSDITVTQQPSLMPGCDEDFRIVEGHFVFANPIPAGGRQVVDGSYRYGQTAPGIPRIHHGVEFVNSTGTAVMASGSGEVVFAGKDAAIVIGEYPDFYGQAVVIQHDVVGVAEPVFTLYGHLSQVNVGVGEIVEVGQEIGRVGLSGIAIGSHLHFEVRIGENIYQATRNPELWLRMLAENGEAQGAVAGIIFGSEEDAVSAENIAFLNLENKNQIFVNTYGDTVNGDDNWQETFAVGGLTPGEYTITFVKGGVWKRTIQIKPGQLTLVTFCIDRK